MLGAQCFGLVAIARNHVRMQRRLEIAEDGVVDAQRRSRAHQRIAQPRHVEQELRAALAGVSALRSGTTGSGSSSR